MEATANAARGLVATGGVMMFGSLLFWLGSLRVQHQANRPDTPLTRSARDTLNAGKRWFTVVGLGLLVLGIAEWVLNR